MGPVIWGQVGRSGGTYSYDDVPSEQKRECAARLAEKQGEETPHGPELRRGVGLEEPAKRGFSGIACEEWVR